MTRKHYYVAFFALLLVGAIAYRLGIEVTKIAWSDSLASTQAMLNFNHLKEYEQLSECLSKGMTEEAALKLEMSIITQKELISEHLRTSDDQRLIRYISIRYPQGIENLRDFKSNRGDRWTEPSCN